MRRSIFSPPDDFAIAPLLSLLPIRGKVGRLEALTSSLFARYEKVSSQLEESQGDSSSVNSRKLSAEEAMLKQVLDWLEVKPGA